jgi:hypothetical protein
MSEARGKETIMTPTDGTQNSAGKRADVGYGRPPVEHQFKPGQPRPPRKVKSKDDLSKSPLAALWKVLQDQRRVELKGKAVWISNAELILRKAFEFAEKDASPTISGLVAELMLVGEDSPGSETRDRTIFDENATPGSVTYLVSERPGNDSTLPFADGSAP